MNKAPSNEGDSKELVPRRAPGRITRKARMYSLEIKRLRQLDYTLDAIREALADAGVDVSISTVRREFMRQEAGPPSAMPDATPLTESGATPADEPLTRLFASGKEFINSLVRTKEQP